MTKNTRKVPTKGGLKFTTAFAVLMTTATLSQTALSDEQQAAIERGEAASALCMACHQADGSGKHVTDGESWPRLAGLNHEYLAAQMHAFKEGTRDNPSMNGFVQMLNDEQIQDLALYYESLPATAGEAPEVSEDVLALGEKLATRGDWDRYIVTCQSCHGPGNTGVGAHFPGIAGQHAGYLSAQLKHWQANERSSDPQELMASVARRLNDEDIEAVSAWLATQPATYTAKE